jgi:hypothetical protein
VDALVGAVADERALDRVAVGPAQVDAVAHPVVEVAVVEHLDAADAAVAGAAQLDAVVEAGDLAVLDDRAGGAVEDDAERRQPVLVAPARRPVAAVGAVAGDGVAGAVEHGAEAQHQAVALARAEVGAEARGARERIAAGARDRAAALAGVDGRRQQQQREQSEDEHDRSWLSENSRSRKARKG